MTDLLNLIYQSDEQGSAIEEHVESVGNESQRVSQKSVEELDEGERQVDAQKPQQVPGIAIRQNQPDPTNKSNKYINEINYVKI